MPMVIIIHFLKNKTCFDSNRSLFTFWTVSGMLNGKWLLAMLFMFVNSSTE